MTNLVRFFYVNRYVFLLIMMVSSVVNLFFLIGSWEVFWGVLLGQVWSGQCIFSFINKKEMRFSIGATVPEDGALMVRLAVAVIALFAYILLFFFDGY